MSEGVSGRVRTSGRTRARACVRLHVHWPRAHTKSTLLLLISVRAKVPTKKVKKGCVMQK